MRLKKKQAMVGIKMKSLMLFFIEQKTLLDDDVPKALKNLKSIALYLVLFCFLFFVLFAG